MLCGECFFVDDDYVCDCEKSKGCTVGEKRVWDEKYLEEHNITKDDDQQRGD